MANTLIFKKRLDSKYFDSIVDESYKQMDVKTLLEKFKLINGNISKELEASIKHGIESQLYV